MSANTAPRVDWLNQRLREPEIQDQPDRDGALLEQALHGLKRINRWSRTHAALWSAMRPLARAARPDRLRILDIAYGSGGVAIALWHRAHRKGLELNVEGYRLNPRTVALAHRQAD